MQWKAFTLFKNYHGRLALELNSGIGFDKMSASRDLRTPTSSKKPLLSTSFSISTLSPRFTVSVSFSVFFLFDYFLCVEGQKELFSAIAIPLIVSIVFKFWPLFHSEDKNRKQLGTVEEEEVKNIHFNLMSRKWEKKQNKTAWQIFLTNKWRKILFMLQE